MNDLITRVRSQGGCATSGFGGRRLGPRQYRTDRPDEERGSGTVLAVIIVLIVCVVAYWTMVFIGWVGCIHQARSAADMASLAGAHAMQNNQDACREATRIAEANGAELVSCESTLGIGEHVVEVTVAVRLEPSLPGAPSTIKETSTAGQVES